MIGAIAIGLAVWGLNLFNLRLAGRLLEPLPTAILLLGIIFFHIPNCEALYIRAHKRDPIFPLSVTSNLLLGISIWWLGRHYGPLGAAAAYLSIVAAIILPWQSLIWWQIRKDHDS